MLKVGSCRSLACCLLVLLPLGATSANGDATPATQRVEGVVRQAYVDVLGRAPDPEGLATYREALTAGGRDAVWLRRELRRSDEYRVRRAQRRRAWHAVSGLGATLGLGTSWVGLAGLLWALGDVITRRLLREIGCTLDAGQRLWVGCAAVVCALQVVSLARPIDRVCLIVFAVAGAVAMVDSAAARHRASRATPSGGGVSHRLACWGRRVLFAILLASVIIAAAPGIAQPVILAYDTLLYHLNAVRWANTYPTLPGLANLHIRLGTNSAWLLLAALVDNGPFDGRSAWIMPGLAVVLFAAYLLHVAVIADRPGRLARLTAILLLPYAAGRLPGLWPSLYFDDAAQMLLAVCVVELIRLAEDWHRSGGGLAGLDTSRVISCGVTGYLAFVIKPIGAPLVMVATALVLVYCGSVWRKHGWRMPRRLVLPALPLLLPLGWVLRNAVLSGWLLFPAAVLPLPVDWAVPREPPDRSHVAMLQSVTGLKSIIRAWARRPGATRFHEAMSTSWRDWFPDWWRERRESRELKMLLPVGAVGVVAGLVILILSGRGWRWQAGVSILLALQLTFWFLSAPDLRFGGGLFRLWAAWGLALPLGAVGGPMRLRRAMPWLALTGALAVSAGVIGPVRARWRACPWQMGRAGASAIESVTIAGDSGRPPLTVFVPVRGDQVGDAPLPATPYPRDTLRARRPGNLRHGFRVTP